MPLQKYNPEMDVTLVKFMTLVILPFFTFFISVTGFSLSTIVPTNARTTYMHWTVKDEPHHVQICCHYSHKYALHI